MVLSGYYGPSIWAQPISTLIPLPSLLGSTSVLDVWVPFLLSTFFVFHLPSCIHNVLVARRAQSLPLFPVFLEWTPMLTYTLSIGLWLYSPHSTLIRDNHLLLFCLTMSLVFGRMTTKIILAHLTHQPFPYWTVLLVPLLGGALLGNLPRLGLPAVHATTELWYLRGYFAFAAVVYGRWAVLVISSICDYLGINCLTITEKPAPGQVREGERVVGLPSVERRVANGGAVRKGD